MKRPSCKILTLVVLGFVLATLSCSNNSTGPNEVHIPGLPEPLNDGWKVSAMPFQGIYGEPIRTLSERIADGDFGNVYSLLIARNDYLVFEEYYDGHDVNQLQKTYSVTKSVVSALIGVAIDKGYIAGVDQKIADFFPEYEAIFSEDSTKQDIRLWHILTMTAGFEWHELTVPYSDSRNSWNLMHASADWIKFVLERPIVDAPGTRFEYNSGCSILLGWILERATGMQADELAEAYLFQPLGITDFEWDRASFRDMPHTASGLRLRVRDMGKIGKLYLNDGKWDGAQIIPENWVSESISPKIQIDETTFYGYQWWSLSYIRIPDPATGVRETRYIQFAAGYGGQHILLVPVNDMLVVLTGGNGDDGTNFGEMLFGYVLQAVIG